jgi:hypothetical protein
MAFIPLFFTSPGYLSVDEGAYHMMAKNIVNGSGFEIWNGYREFPSKELIAGALVVAKDRLVAVPPELFSLVAAPFYFIFGYQGLFVLNAVAFLGVLLLTHKVALKLFGDSRLALNACLILGLTTYLWDYSQAAWPHATSTFFIIAAFYAMGLAFYSEKHSGSMIRWSFLAGLLGGLAPGIRLDAAFAIPALLIPPIFARPPRWKSVFATGLGLLPGIIALSLINHRKFGTFSPFSYGREGFRVTGSVLPYLPLIATGILILLIGWIVSRKSVRDYLRRKEILIMAVTAGCAVAIFSIPQARAFMERLADGAAQLLIDFRFRALEIVERGLGRTSTGGFVYIGGFKKSLLQSCPYIVVLLIPLVRIFQKARDAKAISLLLIVPACFLGVYSYFAWHGGLCLNLRYLVPTLPFAAILAAYAWRELKFTPSRSWWLIGFFVFMAAVIILTLGLDPASDDGGNHEFFILSLPLLIAGILAFLAVMVLLGEYRRFAPKQIAGLRKIAATVFMTAMVWAGSVVFFYDYPLERARRVQNHDVAARVGQVISDDSIIFVLGPDAYFGLIERPRVRIAMPTQDKFRDFHKLVDWHLDQGRPVYASLTDQLWQVMRDQGFLEGWVVQDILGDGFLMQIKKKER